MTSHPLPDTPSHEVLLQIAYGDHQVSDYAAAVEARTIGASVYEPALDLGTNRARDRNMFFGLAPIARYPFRGSAIEIWDSGPGRVQPPPLENLAAGERSDEQGSARGRSQHGCRALAEVGLPATTRRRGRRMQRAAVPHRRLHAVRVQDRSTARPDSAER